MPPAASAAAPAAAGKPACQWLTRDEAEAAVATALPRVTVGTDRCTFADGEFPTDKAEEGTVTAYVEVDVQAVADVEAAKRTLLEPTGPDGRPIVNLDPVPGLGDAAVVVAGSGKALVIANGRMVAITVRGPRLRSNDEAARELIAVVAGRL